MKKFLIPVTLFSMLFVFAAAGLCSPDASVSASTVKAGDTVTIEGSITPGQDLYIAIGQQKMFACKDTKGAYETKKFKKDSKKKGFSLDTEIPPLYYLLTTAPEKFGKVAKKKFGGPSVLLGKGNGIYSTTMFYLKKKFDDAMKVFNEDEKKKRLDELEKVMSSPDFWNDPKRAQEVTKEAQKIRKMFEEAKEIEGLFEDIEVAVELSDEDPEMVEQISQLVEEVEEKVKAFELEMILNGRYDQSSAYLSVHPGAGGTESHDWAQMLLRMYTRWAERHGFSVDVVDYQPGEEAGVKSATILIKGEYAYGYLKHERGVHRLVRISPFDASHRRHTSFASVNVIPEIEGDVDIEIKPDEIRIDTFRASGHGGQYVNKTESAVRITHIPTGIVVSIQTERSQHKNKEIAMKILKARLLQLELEKRKEKKKEFDKKKKEISWGSQIRSYILHPYRLIKDHRTGVEIGDVERVLDGDIDPFVEAYFKNSAQEGS